MIGEWAEMPTILNMEEFKDYLSFGNTYLDVSNLTGVRSTRDIRKVFEGIKKPSETFKRLMLLEIRFQRGKLKMKDLDLKLASDLGIRSSTLKPFSDWVHPSPTEIKTLCDLIGTSSEVGSRFGIRGRSVRKFIGGVDPIPYTVWACLVLDANIGAIWNS